MKMFCSTFFKSGKNKNVLLHFFKSGKKIEILFLENYKGIKIK